MTLEERIARLEDLEAIKQLKHQYLNACDLKQVERIRDCFADGEILVDYGPIGVFKSRESFLDIFQSMACHDHVIDLHHGGNPEITVDGDQAKGIWSLFYFNLDGNTQATRQIGGMYEDEYRRIDGQWKMVKTTFIARSMVSSAD